MLTSLNIATDGLLDRGNNPALAIATRGLLATIIIIVAAKSKYHLVGEDFDLQAALKEDKELMEILTIILQTGLFD